MCLLDLISKSTVRQLWPIEIKRSLLKTLEAALQKQEIVDQNTVWCKPYSEMQYYFPLLEVQQNDKSR